MTDLKGKPTLSVSGAQNYRPSRRIHCTEDARLIARRRVPRMMFDFVEGAAGNELGTQRNSHAIKQTLLQPRVLVKVDNRTIHKELLGQTMGLPFGIAPMGMCNLTWPGADTMLAAQAVRCNIPLCLSSAASTTLEDMHAITAGRAWFQLYVGQSREAAMELVDRAEAAGYEHLILTVDVPQVSRRIRDLRNGFQIPFTMGFKQFFDFASHPHWSLSTLLRGVPRVMNFATTKHAQGFVRNESRGNTDWAFLDALRRRWQGKLIVKGVLAPADAVRIRDAGVDAVYVSNHGARQLDSVMPAIAALPRIRAAVGSDYPLIFDSGIRNGEDVVKALALGADFAMLGRPLMYAIGAEGERGLATLVDIISEEISVTLAQLGYTNIEDIDSSVIAGLSQATDNH